MMIHHEFPAPLYEGQLLRRYKRFFADVELTTGEVVVAHCPNTGSMLSCTTPKSPVLLSQNLAPSRKLKFTWEAVKVCGSWVCVNTMRTNPLVARAIQVGALPTFSGYQTLRTEVPYGLSRSRIDILLSDTHRPLCYIEVKNTTLAYGDVAAFPDATTTRGQKHLNELCEMVRLGFRAAMVYVVQRSECTRFRPADEIDPTYGTLLRQAIKLGVEAIAVPTLVTYEGIKLLSPIPIEL